MPSACGLVCGTGKSFLATAVPTSRPDSQCGYGIALLKTFSLVGSPWLGGHMHVLFVNNGSQ
eukprot:8440972-Lingulodinium_polyedra.AAC.1